MSEREPARPIVHMVGSIPLDDAESVFRTLSETLGPHLVRIPDGETGRRRRWISFIADQLKAHPALEPDPDVPLFEFKQWSGKVVYAFARLRFRADSDPARATFATGYADDAIRNFQTFDRLQRDGVIPRGVRYQLCMATPLAIAYNFISPRARPAFTPVYADHLAGEIRRIAEALPYDRLSWQWDVCQEVLMWEGYFEQTAGYKDEILSMLGRIGDLIPADIDLGYHLCYGSPGDEHMVQPTDMANLVEITNGLLAAVRRPVQYIHMPVPRDRTDSAYFAPLTGLALPAGTALYLGLVHAGDDAGNVTRLALARRFAPVAGIAAECGLGRGDPARLAQALDAHRRLAETG